MFLRILFVLFNGSVVTRRSQILVTIKIHKLGFLKFIQLQIYICVPLVLQRILIKNKIHSSDGLFVQEQIWLGVAV
ncbi:hypothetical protein Hanom_Chr02g00151951 [Helianthus anomalus]